MQTEQQTITTGFVCAYEVHDKTTFQSEGHFVSGLKDENGFRREWIGEEVHILTLSHQGQQVLRMMADSLEEVSKLMAANVQQTFLGLWTAQFLQGFSHDAFVRQRDRLAELQAFIDEQYAAEIKRGQHGVFQDSIAAAMYYMGQERELKAGEASIADANKRESKTLPKILGRAMSPGRRKTLERRKANRQAALEQRKAKRKAAKR
jgi:hypothetical protein